MSFARMGMTQDRVNSLMGFYARLLKEDIDDISEMKDKIAYVNHHIDPYSSKQLTVSAR